MDCLAIFHSGNYAFAVCNIFEKKGYVFDVVSTPCKIAKGGCGYCLKIPLEFVQRVIDEGKINRMPVLEVYKIIPMFTKNKYELIYSYNK